MKVLVTGVKGQLGYDVVRELQKRGHEAVGVDIDEMDITDAAGHTRYESYGVVVGLDANGDLVVLDIGPQTESDSPLY